MEVATGWGKLRVSPLPDARLGAAMYDKALIWRAMRQGREAELDQGGKPRNGEPLVAPQLTRRSPFNNPPERYLAQGALMRFLGTASIHELNARFKTEAANRARRLEKQRQERREREERHQKAPAQTPAQAEPQQQGQPEQHRAPAQQVHAQPPPGSLHGRQQAGAAGPSAAAQPVAAAKGGREQAVHAANRPSGKSAPQAAIQAVLRCEYKRGRGAKRRRVLGSFGSAEEAACAEDVGRLWLALRRKGETLKAGASFIGLSLCKTRSCIIYYLVSSR